MGNGNVEVGMRRKEEMGNGNVEVGMRGKEKLGMKMQGKC